MNQVLLCFLLQEETLWESTVVKEEMKDEEEEFLHG
jgi:hypothetical protein